MSRNKPPSLRMRLAGVSNSTTVPIRTASSGELTSCTIGEKLTLVENNEAVVIGNRFQSVRNREQERVLELLADGCLDLGICLKVLNRLSAKDLPVTGSQITHNRARGFIHDDDVAAPEQRTRKRNQLALTLREVRATR